LDFNIRFIKIKFRTTDNPILRKVSQFINDLAQLQM